MEVYDVFIFLFWFGTWNILSYMKLDECIPFLLLVASAGITGIWTVRLAKIK